VSGSYMQVLPSFVSVDEDGKEHDFLSEFGLDRDRMLLDIFLKGYQWPFDVRKLEKGSSIIDMICYLELEKGRKVYLDYMVNPGGEDIDFDALPKEARDYLIASGSVQRTPVERLRHLNEPAYSFYLDKGVDLERERLEISLSAQHNNGGLAIDCWWQSNIEGLFPVGEVAASHGVYRPGGSALNSGQCASRRASLFISRKRNDKDWCFSDQIDDDDIIAIAENARNGSIRVQDAYNEARRRMSIDGSAIRNIDRLSALLSYVKDAISSFSDVCIEKDNELWLLFEYRNALYTQLVYLSAMLDYAKRISKSRGSALYSDPDGDIHPDGFDERFTYSLEDDKSEASIQECMLSGGVPVISYRRPRPIPEDDDFFENVWSIYRKNGCVY
ncbi:MAG: FAD-binding protein, partial [Candidatus Ornithospirochaeta sp.]|nr:FAD-binding protein [Candidatus Ornithospirochaeta sp.]